MGEDWIFARINNILSGSGYTARIGNLSELHAFLNSTTNKKLEVYEEIADLYSALRLGPGMW